MNSFSSDGCSRRARGCLPGPRRRPELPILALMALCAFASLPSVQAEAKRDYYDVLGVNKKADAKAIKQAYRKLALKWHPDKNPDNREQAEKEFREVAEAYEVLSNEESKRKYDQFGHEGLSGGGGGGGFGGFDFGFGGGGFKDPNDLFKEMFGDKDPFADFSKFFEDIVEETTGDSADIEKAREDLAAALVTFYKKVGQHDKAERSKVMDVLKMPKWDGKEMKMFRNLQKKYGGSEHAEAVQELQVAFEEFEKTAGSSHSGGFGGDFGGGFGGFGGGDFGGFGDLGKMFGGGAFGDLGMNFGGGMGGGASSFSFSSFTSTGGGKTVKSETRMEGGRRVTKTIETDGEKTKATMEESKGGRTTRKTGVRHGSMDQEQLGNDEM